MVARGVEPSAALAQQLVDHAPAGAADRLERLAAWERIVAWAQARQIIEIAGFVDAAAAAPAPGSYGLEAVESAEAEIALMLRTTTNAAGCRADEARTWVHRHPATLAALGVGEITLAQARVIADGLTELDEAAAAAAEAQLLARATRQTPGQLREAVRRAVLHADPDAAARRQARQRRERKVVLYPERDGTATLSATLPAAEATGMWAVLDQHARACRADDGRSMDARRVDTLVDLVLGETGFASTATAATATAGWSTPPEGSTGDSSAAGAVADDAPATDDSPVAGSAVADSAVAGSAVAGSAVADTAVAGSPVAGSAAAGSPVAGSPVTDSPATDNAATGSCVAGTDDAIDLAAGPPAAGQIAAGPGESYPGESADRQAGPADRAAWGRWLTRNHTTDRDPISRQAEEDRLLSRAPSRGRPAGPPAAHPSTARPPDPTRLPGLAPPGGAPACRTQVSIQIRVTVPLDVLAGHNDEHAELAGYGPITADQARALAADPDSVWRRLVTDPLSGALLDVGSERYRPPAHLAEHVVSRHTTCQFPGCRTPAHRCDLDHNTPFGTPGGATSSANLGPKCRPHHRIKGMPGWAVSQHRDGAIVWTTPSGHRYRVEPPPVGPVRSIAAPAPIPDHTPPPL